MASFFRASSSSRSLRSISSWAAMICRERALGSRLPPTGMVGVSAVAMPNPEPGSLTAASPHHSHSLPPGWCGPRHEGCCPCGGTTVLRRLRGSAQLPGLSPTCPLFSAESLWPGGSTGTCGTPHRAALTPYPMLCPSHVPWTLGWCGHCTKEKPGCHTPGRVYHHRLCPLLHMAGRG